MSVTQTTFRNAVFTANDPMPNGLVDGQGRPADNRFSVYRNNVTFALLDALHKSFPILHKLVGTDSFTSMARAFIQAHPPTDPRMMYYGQAMPDFLATFAPLMHVGYLPDVAHLECALRASYHAADAKPMAATLLSNLRETQSLVFAPSLKLVQSTWPLWDIWHYNTVVDAAKPREIHQDVLVTRQIFDPTPHAVSIGGGVWMAHLMSGAPLGLALDAAYDVEPEFEMTCLLMLLVQENALIEIL
ncbi:MAG: DNA-binding domain-containing protein [Paracoccaceae bacterium]